MYNIQCFEFSFRLGWFAIIHSSFSDNEKKLRQIRLLEFVLSESQNLPISTRYHSVTNLAAQCFKNSFLQQGSFLLPERCFTFYNPWLPKAKSDVWYSDTAVNNGFHIYEANESFFTVLTNTAVKCRACANGYIFWQPHANFPRKNLK